VIDTALTRPLFYGTSDGYVLEPQTI
jgi:hypothetical protein